MFSDEASIRSFTFILRCPQILTTYMPEQLQDVWLSGPSSNVGTDGLAKTILRHYLPRRVSTEWGSDLCKAKTQHASLHLSQKVRVEVDMLHRPSLKVVFVQDAKSPVPRVSPIGWRKRHLDVLIHRKVSIWWRQRLRRMDNHEVLYHGCRIESSRFTDLVGSFSG